MFNVKWGSLIQQQAQCIQNALAQLHMVEAIQRSIERQYLCNAARGG